MPSIRTPALRTALQPSARLLPRTQPFLTQTRQESRNTRDEKWYEPNNGDKTQAKPQHQGTTGGYNLDGTSSMGSSRGLMYVQQLSRSSRGIGYLTLGT